MGIIDTDVPLPTAWPPPRDPRAVAAALDAVRRRDPIGHRVHIAFAAFYLFTLPLSTAGSGVSFALLLGYTLLRAPNTWRCYTALLRVPMLWLLAAWLVWTTLSIAWTSNAGQGWDEVQAARVVLTPLMLWPVLDCVVWLIAAALLGVVGQNLVQALQALRWLGFEPGMNNRLDGSLHAIQAGAWCAAAMCWHLIAGLEARSRMRWLSFAGLALAAVGLVATGSRGPWIAAAVAVPALLVVIAIRRPATRRVALLVMLLGVVLAAAGWPIARRMVVPRVERAIAEVQDARERGDYVTSAGLRIGLWKWALEIAGKAPAAGTGAGSYQDELWKIDEYRAVVDREQPDEERVEFLTRDHAHSSYLHALATTGGIGALLLVAAVAMTAWRCVRLAPDHPYADGTLFALVTWIVGAQFDCYHLNGHLFGLLVLIMAVSLRTPDE